MVLYKIKIKHKFFSLYNLESPSHLGRMIFILVNLGMGEWKVLFNFYFFSFPDSLRPGYSLSHSQVHVWPALHFCIDSSLTLILEYTLIVIAALLQYLSQQDLIITISMTGLVLYLEESPICSFVEKNPLGCSHQHALFRS